MAGMALNAMIIKVLSEIGFDRQKNFERTDQPAIRAHFHPHGWLVQPAMPILLVNFASANRGVKLHGRSST
jgi:hypothetical protein